MNLTAEQLKGRIRLFADKNQLRAQEVLQMAMFEQLLSRLEISSYCDNFIIKGGVLIASMIGINSRTTMDLDTSIQGIKMDAQNIQNILNQIFKIDLEDGIYYVFDSISNIRETDQYENFRVHLYANFGKMNIPMKIDITTGDAITPDPIVYEYKKIFDKQPINIKAYPLETVLAEKYETILRRNISTTRARDFYDLYILYNMYINSIEIMVLRKAILRTAQRRNSMDILQDYDSIIDDISSEGSLRNLWENYKRENRYISNIKFEEVVIVIRKIANAIGI